MYKNHDNEDFLLIKISVLKYFTNYIVNKN